MLMERYCHSCDSNSPWVFKKSCFREKADSGCYEHLILEARLGFWDGMGGSSDNSYEEEREQMEQYLKTPVKEANAMAWDGSRSEGSKLGGFYTWLYLPLLLLQPMTNQFVAMWALWDREQSCR